MLSTSRNMKSLLDSLKSKGVITTQRVYDAMVKVDRGDFINSSPYDDCPQYIDYNATISAPHMHAYALEYLVPYLKDNCKALDVGSGSGYLTVAMSKMMNDTGVVVGIEHISGLFEIGQKNINKNHSDLVKQGKIVLVNGDGRKGYKDKAPYNAIHVGAAAEEVPTDLVDQLANGGRMVIPVGKQKWEQQICLIDKDMNGKVTCQKVLGVSYVPLTSVEKQLGK